MNDKPVQLSIWDDIPAPPPIRAPRDAEPIIVTELADWTKVTPDTIMKAGKYKDQPVKDIPYDYLLNMYIADRATGGMRKYIEDLLDATKGNYNNLIYHRQPEYYETNRVS